jgi:integrase
MFTAQSDTSSRNLLACGVAIAPVFYGIALVELLVRPDFDIRRLPISFLSLGPLGWTRQYARIVHRWVKEVELDPAAYGTHTLRRTKASLIYGRTKNLRAVQLLLEHSELKITGRYLGVEVDDARRPRTPRPPVAQLAMDNGFRNFLRLCHGDSSIEVDG